MWAWVRNQLLTLCCHSYEVSRSDNTIEVQLQMIQYIFRIKVLSKDTSSFQRQDWLKNDWDNEVETRGSMSKTKHTKCEWDRLWSVKWMRRKWNEYMNRLTSVHEMVYGEWDESESANTQRLSLRNVLY